MHFDDYLEWKQQLATVFENIGIIYAASRTQSQTPITLLLKIQFQEQLLTHFLGC